MFHIMSGQNLADLQVVKTETKAGVEGITLALDDENAMYYLIVEATGDNPYISFFIHNSVNLTTFRFLVFLGQVVTGILILLVLCGFLLANFALESEIDEVKCPMEMTEFTKQMQSYAQKGNVWDPENH